MKWIIENITKEKSFTELAQAVRESEHELFTVDGDYDRGVIDRLTEFASDETALVLGSIGMCELICRDVPNASMMRTPEAYFVSSYCDILECFNSLCELPVMGNVSSVIKYTKDDCVFIRPDRGDKPFKGRVFSLDELPLLRLDQEFTDVVISTPKTILGEYRFVCSKSEAIAASSYRILGQPVWLPDVPEKATDRCLKELLKLQNFPDPVFVMDICNDADGDFWVLELNAFSGSGLYACDKAAIVHGVCDAMAGHRCLPLFSGKE